MIDATLAKKIAQDVFGINGLVTILPGEYDINFHVKTREENEFLLKISPPNEDKAILAMQNEALLLLKTVTGACHFPQLQPTINGEWIGHFTDYPNIGLVRLFTFVPGKLFVEMHHHSPQLLASLGQQLGQLSLALQHFQHPAAKRFLKWDLKQATWIRKQLHVIEKREDQECIDYFLQKFENEVVNVLPTFRQSVIHGDINDYNILVTSLGLDHDSVTGFIDFGDLVETATICELAIAIAYAMLKKPDPLATAAIIIKAYHAVFPLHEKEIDILFELICIRLCTSLVNAAINKKAHPHNTYLTVTEAPAFELLRKLRSIHPRFARYIFRDACGLTPCPQTTVLIDWLHQAPLGSLLEKDLQTMNKAVLDLSPNSLQGENFAETLEKMHQSGVEIVIGQYNETRLCYSGQQYQTESNQGIERRTLHLGLDLFLQPDVAIFAPLQGVIHSFADNNRPEDYGPTIILKHVITEKNLTFYTLYGHLSRESLKGLTKGKVVHKGERIGWIGETSVNGGWPPHLHFQLIADIFDAEGNFPGVAPASKKSVWLSICPDPNLMTRIALQVFPEKKLTKSVIETIRSKHVGKNVGLSYRNPLEINRGIGQYLFDETGRQYLDCVNNVCHVGHCHPKVVKAGQRQMALLNTNTRYLHENLSRYAEKLVATLPSPLTVCFFVCSGSEANELALRLAKTYTGKTDFLVMDHGYYGNTSTLINISPYKFNGSGGSGKPDFVHVLPMPDPLRNAVKQASMPSYDNLAAFISESLPSCGGQVVLPPGYLKHAYDAVRKAGGLCIADEVQVGLGRVGTHFWGFETQGVVPDIVTMGKPLGNGHPIGAVVTTREIADAFCNGMEYFNTFGGNPVSCAIGLAVLDVLQEENLQAHALQTGDYLKQKLNKLKEKYAFIGDVRGLGLFLGIEIVTDKNSLVPAKDHASFIVNRMKERGILLSTDGPFHNVIKIKPPLVFNKENSDVLVENLEVVLSWLS